jgi:hypothetical protein
VASTAVEYGVSSVPLGSALVVMESNGAVTAMESCCVAIAGVVSESVTCTVNMVLPVAVGVPVMAPVLLFNVAQPGNAPLEMLQI